MAINAQHMSVSRLGSPDYGSRTDVGRVREHNEDSLAVNDPLYAVFDGMGGHAAGEVASAIAAQVVTARAPEDLDVEALGQAVQEANLEILRAAREGRGRKGMGTTCTAIMLKGEQLNIAQVGDSRCYLLHEGRLQQLTRDHSYVADLVEQGAITKDYARIHPDRSKITRALGTDPNMVPDLYEINVSSGDRILLCSDGLYSMVIDDDIEHILCRERDPQKAADKLVKEANEWGGHDNITVIVVDVAGFSVVKKKRLARKSKITAAIIIALLVAIIGGAAWGLNTFVSNSAYLGESNGYVAIYHGVPGWGSDDSPEVSTVKIADLDESVANRIRNGEVKYSNLKDAQDLVKTYEQQLEQQQKAAAQEEAAKQSSAETSAQSTAGATSAESVGAN